MIQLVAPIFFCLLIVFFQWKSNEWAGQEIYQTTEFGVDRIPHCFGDSDCLTVGYSIIGDPSAVGSDDQFAYINEIMKNLATDNQLLFNKDVKLLSIGSVDMFYDYINNNQNMT